MLHGVFDVNVVCLGSVSVKCVDIYWVSDHVPGQIDDFKSSIDWLVRHIGQTIAL